MGNVDTLARPESPWVRKAGQREHAWHSMSSYLGAFPPGLARFFINLLTNEGSTVLDPFAGRGTTHLEARLAGRTPLSSDLNPLAVALTSAKNSDVQLHDVLSRIDELQARFDKNLYIPEAHSQPDDIQLIFHPYTLAQLCYLRRVLNQGNTPADPFLIGTTLGIMHGSERKDGTSAYASISMPNTFSMSPNYVRRFVQSQRLFRTERDVFQLLRDKTLRLFRRSNTPIIGGTVIHGDAKRIAHEPAFAEYRGHIDLVLTSPPYLGVVNYAKQNWIRLWFLHKDGHDMLNSLDDDLQLEPWILFMEQVLGQLRKMVSPSGVIVLVIGDVARSSTNIVSPARELIRRIHHHGTFGYVGCISDYLDVEGKTTRVWNDTRGKATSVDRVVILANSAPTFNTPQRNHKIGGDAWLKLSPDLASNHAKAFAGIV